MPFLKKISIYTFSVFVAFCLLFQFSTKPHLGEFLSLNYWQQVIKYAKALAYVRTYYINPESTNYEDLATSSISGLLTPLDEYSGYLTPENYHAFNQSTSRSYIGIGVALRETDLGILITDVVENSPAEQAGIQANTFIVEVNGDSMKDSNLSQLIGLLRSFPRGSIQISTAKEPSSEWSAHMVTVDEINVSHIKKLQVFEDNIGYLSIQQFSESIVPDFCKAINSLQNDGATRLIIDLRYNPGGLLDVTLDLVDLFFNKGELIITADFNDRRKSKPIKAIKPIVIKDIPIVILINQGSASSSEIFAGAMQATNRALIIGKQSFGKGSIQNIFELDSLSAIKVTTAYYLLPDGRNINKEGVVPDIIVEIPSDGLMGSEGLIDYFPNQKKALLKKLGNDRSFDTQLNSAIDYLKSL